MHTVPSLVDLLAQCILPDVDLGYIYFICLSGLLSLQQMVSCRYLMDHGYCPHGCGPRRTFCHNFARKGRCRRDFCPYLHRVAGGASSRSNAAGGSGERCDRSRSPSAEPAHERYNPEQKALVLLGLNPTRQNVSWSLITASYRARALQEHPDKVGPGSTERMQQLNNAMKVLKPIWNC